METSDTIRLTAGEMKELEGLAFAQANYSLTTDEQRRYDELVNKERQTRV